MRQLKDTKVSNGSHQEAASVNDLKCADQISSVVSSQRKAGCLVSGTVGTMCRGAQKKLCGRAELSARASWVKVSVLARQVRLSCVWTAGGDTAVSPDHVVKLSVLHWRDTAIPLWHQLKRCSHTEPTM